MKERLSIRVDPQRLEKLRRIAGAEAQDDDSVD
jgi:hypothetical protein